MQACAIALLFGNLPFPSGRLRGLAFGTFSCTGAALDSHRARCYHHARTAAVSVMKTLKALVGLLVVVAAFYVAWKLIPPYFNEYQFEDSIAQIAKYSVYDQRKTDQDVRDEVAKKAREYDIPLTAEQINVVREGTEITISAQYTLHIDLSVYAFYLKFTPTTKGKRI